MKRMVLLVAAAVLAACATTSGGDATEHRSGFSGGRIVSISPHGAICPIATMGVGCSSLGAYWDSTRPDRAQLVVIDGPQDSKAFHAIGRFLAQVDASPTK